MFFNILIIGPCDSGKTTFIESISKKLDKRFNINYPNLSANSPINANNPENYSGKDENKTPDNQIQRKRSIRKTSIGKLINIINKIY